ncbi:hypothetical protein FFLO_02719 [Filobasidium floriforme]|uniref:PUA domain-containing protein n=1 Tax=Filobasidium floriforme TaxID=5210 RepID=A0A8K0JM42_9TREE|nr:hypothetical protein FFLO_02719 [Filobasidium floriforme]
MHLAVSISRPNLISLGTCFGKFSKTGKFKLQVGSLDYLAQYAKYKVWIKPAGELPFLYGNHVVKAHLGRITEDTPEHQGVVVFSMSDTPLGFGVTARSTVDTRKLDPTGIIVFHQADVGEYLRDEVRAGIRNSLSCRFLTLLVFTFYRTPCFECRKKGFSLDTVSPETSLVHSSASVSVSCTAIYVWYRVQPQVFASFEPWKPLSEETLRF